MSGADERFERALGGDPPYPPEDELNAFVRGVRDAFPAEPMLAEDAHLEAIVDAARRISAETRPPTRKELRVRFPKLRSKSAMVVAGFVVAMSSFGGLAVAGALPAGVQNSVANAAATVGVNLQGGDDESPEVEDDATETETLEPTETEAPEPTEAPEADDQGENEQSGDQGGDNESEADDQGENEQSGDQGGSEDESDDLGDGGSGDGESD
jgi:hypothetical protein